MAKIDDSVKKKVPELRFPGFTDDWEERKLGDLGSVAMNKRIFKEQTSDVGDIPFYKIGTFGGTPDAFISRDIFEEYKSKYQYPEVGDILISASGSIGRTVVYQGYDEYFQDSNIVWLKHDQQLDNSFLKQFYSIVKWQGLEGSTIKRLYNKNILETKITLPSPEEQAQLGSFFKQLDDTIALHQRKLDLLKEQKKGYLQKMFPKNGAKVPELRFAGFADDWEERKLGEVSNIKTGSSDLQDATDNGEYPFFVRSEKIERSHRYLFDGEAILIPGEGRLGEIYHYINGKFDFHQRVYKISNFTDFKVSGMYILYYMQHNFKRHALKFTVKATVDSLRLPMLTDFDIKIPLEEEQTKIGSFFKQLDNTIALHQRKLDLLKEQKKGFLQKMFV
ncbi:restriction endonuclease subunit S [Pediococcus pentosaceus]|uniref:restriction endonuclease subunit S n=1 Tax=Pediococcus pentosaceus TaxID=1255 RepID=UPI001C4325B9|nr:restriction endonuclease subunit S [Pediococcus pentosaceus]